MRTAFCPATIALFDLNHKLYTLATLPSSFPFQDAFNYFKAEGTVTGLGNPTVGSGSSCFPYQLKECGHHEASPLIPCPQVCSPGECATPKCPKQCSESKYPTAWKADKTKAKGGAFRMSSVAAAQAEIMAHGSIAAAFTVYSDFLTYTSGVYTHKSYVVAHSSSTARRTACGTNPSRPHNLYPKQGLGAGRPRREDLRLGHGRVRHGLLARRQLVRPALASSCAPTPLPPLRDLDPSTLAQCVLY